MRMLRRAVLFAALLLAPLSHAAELGALTVLSSLGQPLNAEIEIRSLKPGEEKTLAARLASPEAFRRSGVPFSRELAELRFSIGRSAAGRPVVRLTTARAVNEPFLDALIVLRSDAGSRTRRYTLLLDPKGYQPPPAVAAIPVPSPKPKVAAKPEPAAPATRDALFGITPAPQAPEPAAASSRDALFGITGSPETRAAERKPVAWGGYVQNTLAYDYREPKHWSRGVVRTQLGAQGGGPSVKWKATVRVDVDPVYASNTSSDFYPEAVRKDQRSDFFIRETYLDASLGGLQWRVGKQNIVWGEMVGLFFADVVSARDQRDFILPEFEVIRVPQWAVRAERFGEKFHAEAIWLPSPEVDIIGKPGAEFYPYRIPPPAGFAQTFNEQERPPRSVKNSNLGLRASTLRSGWDLAAFYYRSTDVNPTFYREVVSAPTPTVVFTPRHDRIWQVGGTLGKSLGATVAKAEAIYTSGRKFIVTRLSEPEGVVPQDTLDYVVGLDFTFGRDTRLNLQYFERIFDNHDPDLLQDAREVGFSVLLATKIGTSLEPELLVIASANRSDHLVRAKLGWLAARNWRLTLGVDVFDGPVTGFFGRFAGNDRVYLETRYDF